MMTVCKKLKCLLCTDRDVRKEAWGPGDRPLPPLLMHHDCGRENKLGRGDHLHEDALRAGLATPLMATHRNSGHGVTSGLGGDKAVGNSVAYLSGSVRLWAWNRVNCFSGNVSLLNKS